MSQRYPFGKSEAKPRNMKPVLMLVLLVCVAAASQIASQEYARESFELF